MHFRIFRIEDLVQEKSQERDAKKTEDDEKGNSREQFGFGDTLEATERKAYASFIPFCRETKTVELNTSASFTPYSEESSCNVSYKIDEDVMTINSDDEVISTSKQESLFDVRQLDCDAKWNHFFLTLYF